MLTRCCGMLSCVDSGGGSWYRQDECIHLCKFVSCCTGVCTLDWFGMKINSAQMREFWGRDDPQTLEERVYLFLHDTIVNGDLAPGSSMIGSQLAAQLGVSRITVANALRRLSSEGFVIIYPHRGVTVASLDIPTLEEVFRIRHALESEVMAELAESIDENGLARLRQLDAEVCTSLLRNDSVSYRQLERRFHLLVYELSGLSIISSMLTDLWNRLEPYRGRRYTSGILVQDAIDDHQRILSALATHETDIAVQSMRTHVERGHALLREVLSPEGQSVDEGNVSPRRTPLRPKHYARDLTPPPGSLRAFLHRLPDTRRGQGRMYAKEAILTLSVCAMLCGARSGYAISSWISAAPLQVRSAVAWQPERVPSGPTVHRVLSSLDPVELDTVLEQWLVAHHFDVSANAPIQYRRGVHGEKLPGVEIIEQLAALLHAHVQSIEPFEERTRNVPQTPWQRFFGLLLYGSAMPPEATPAELQLRMSFLHTMGRNVL